MPPKKILFSFFFSSLSACSLICADPSAPETESPCPSEHIVEDLEEKRVATTKVLDQTFSEESPPEPLTPFCGKASHPMSLTSRHIESNGIGYNKGYTTLEGFFTPLRLIQDIWLPFIDLRGHSLTMEENGQPMRDLAFAVSLLPVSGV